jgi:hypothetical protein
VRDPQRDNTCIFLFFAGDKWLMVSKFFHLNDQQLEEMRSMRIQK